MPKKILWLDNDAANYLEPYVGALRDEGYDVDVAPTLSRADYLLRSRRYDLLILDVMIPTRAAEEEERYPPELTDYGHKAGFVFYELNKGLLDANSTHVLVLTVRLDSDILAEFIKTGLPRACFATKYDMREIGNLLKKIRDLI